MVDVIGGRPSVPGWLYQRLASGESTNPEEGNPDINQYLPHDGQTTINPTRTIHTIHQKGSQRRYGR